MTVKIFNEKLKPDNGSVVENVINNKICAVKKIVDFNELDWNALQLMIIYECKLNVE